jgi:hypothetical protein
MGAFLGSVAAGVLSGMLVFVVLRSIWGEAGMGELTNAIGIAAVLGAIATAVVARAWARWQERGGSSGD